MKVCIHIGTKSHSGYPTRVCCSILVYIFVIYDEYAGIHLDRYWAREALSSQDAVLTARVPRNCSALVSQVSSPPLRESPERAWNRFSSVTVCCWRTPIWVRRLFTLSMALLRASSRSVSTLPKISRQEAKCAQTRTPCTLLDIDKVLIASVCVQTT